MDEGIWGNVHTHSNCSTLDALNRVKTIVQRASVLGHPMSGLTDHGSMAGVVQHYNECTRLGVAPYPGFEGYLIDPQYEGWEKPRKNEPVGRFHVGLLARNIEGYKGLVRLMSLSHTRPRFSRFPRLMIEDLAEFSQERGDDVVLLTGCYFGLAQQQLVREGFEACKAVVRAYASWFPHTFVEVQHHNIQHEGELGDTEIVVQLMKVASQLGLPVMATQDSHYVYGREKVAHALMKRMVYGGQEDEFPGDSFHLASEEWVAEHYPPQQWARCLEGARHMLDLNEVSIPPLDKFKVYVPELTKDPMREIKRRCLRRLRKMGIGPTHRDYRRYMARLRHEWGVIDKQGMGNYFILALYIMDWCIRHKAAVEVRGSANGSLVCFLLGVSSVDSVLWGTLFERFMSLDRIKPPDIDFDVEDAKRDQLIADLMTKFGLTKIGTYALLGARAEDEKGSILVTYQSYRARQAEKEAREAGLDAEEAKRRKSAVYAKLNDLSDVRRHYGEQDYQGLVELSGLKSVYKSYGVHPGGLLIGTKALRYEDWVPTMLVASSDTTASQYDMDDVENMGLLKLDILGQTTLTAMRLCQEMIGRPDPTDFTWIPMDDKAACRALREGRTDNGIFHFEGYTKAKGGKEMGIKSTKDAILAQALFMPGAMESGQKDHYIRARRDRAFRESVTYIHPIFEKHLKETHGAFVFQDQVVGIMRDLGLSVADINVFYKVVKDSGSGAVERNRERLAPIRAKFQDLCLRAGIDEHDIEPTWHSLAGFMAYGFNKAHATGYGIRAYRCAYLKVHHPLEFMTALLQAWGAKQRADKERVYTREARRVGIRILPPQVNVSGPSWTLDVDQGVIRRGLASIAGIGIKTAVEIAAGYPYASVEDMIARCSPRALTGGKLYLDHGTFGGMLRALHMAGALDELLGEE